MDSALGVIFVVAAVGHFIGRLGIKGIQLGTSGVLLAALYFGHMGYEIPSVIRDLGLALFVGAVGLTAGPRFFRNLRKNAMSYGAIAFATVVSGAVTTSILARVLSIPPALAAGIYTGALTTTPGLAAALEAMGDSAVSIGYGIAYPFGVVGVVMFVQILPRLLRTDLRREVSETVLLEGDASRAPGLSSDPDRLQAAVARQRRPLDDLGMLPLMVVLGIGTALARMRFMIPGTDGISLGLAGGPLIVGLVVGHIGGIGPWSLRPSSQLLGTMREMGLTLFLAGAGVAAGHGFAETVATYGWLLFIGGAIVTLVPMLIGFVLATRAFKLSLSDSLGSICGGMTSTPALGALITAAGSDDVAAPYAATYPFALVLVVVVSQALATILR
ncbi:MAG: permease [Firmicutes bacterium]|jgi:putative transport protein|nr:permease [Bacillota bacterium]